MKKIIFVLVVVLIAICGYFYLSIYSKNTIDDTPKVQLSTEEIIKNKSEEVLISIDENNIERFKTLIHPTKGVRFSKDGVVSLDKDKKFTAPEISNLIEANEVVLWGYADGSGFPINKTFTEYFSGYANFNYSKAPQVAYDEALRGGANTINNIEEKYPNTHFMSYHFPYRSTYINDRGEVVIQPMSWTSLNLVFEEYQGEFYLVGIVNDNWTI